MSLTKFNENVNNHQSLPDKPSQTSAELKELFDKAPNDIKTYLNNVLTAEIDSLISGIQTGKIDVTKIVNDLTTGGATNVASAEMAKSLNNSKLDKTGGNVSGTLNIQGNNNGLYWKENGYGDKFKIAPDFTGADDSNVLKIMGAVGGQGTDPTLVDLVKITGKSGNVIVKGNTTAQNFVGKTNGYTWDISTENTSDTWLPVFSNSKIQHRTIQNIINTYLKSGATTKITSGTANPSGGDNGDIYIQYF
jgi:hypothetical protein